MLAVLRFICRQDGARAMDLRPSESKEVFQNGARILFALIQCKRQRSLVLGALWSLGLASGRWVSLKQLILISDSGPSPMN